VSHSIAQHSGSATVASMQKNTPVLVPVQRLVEYSCSSDTDQDTNDCVVGGERQTSGGVFGVLNSVVADNATNLSALAAEAVVEWPVVSRFDETTLGCTAASAVEAPILSEDEDLFGDLADDESDVEISGTAKVNTVKTEKKAGKRTYDKVLACFFCRKLLKLKIKRHLEMVHAKEPEVEQVLLSSEEDCKLGFARLTNRGNFNHNIRVLESGEGTLIVGRRSSRPVSNSDYLPCVHCLVFFMSSDINRHSRACKFKPTEVESEGSKTEKRVSSLSRMLLEGAMKKKYVQASDKFKMETLSNMRCDELTTLVKKDAVIIRFGCILHHRLGKQRCHDISQRMRQLGRLLQEVNRLNAVAGGQLVNLEQCLSGEKFDIVLEATENLCSQFDDESGRHLFNNPSLGLKLGHTLAKCAELKVGMAIRSMDSNMRAEAEAFMALHKAEWTSQISGPSLASLKKRRYNNPQLLPLTSDLVKLKTFQERQMDMLTASLRKQPTYSTWRSLLEVVYSRVVIFNKRRGGETARLLLSAYEMRPKWEQVASDVLIQTLTPVEQQLLRRYLKKM
jgi:hypothetical protein